MKKKPLKSATKKISSAKGNEDRRSRVNKGPGKGPYKPPGKRRGGRR